MMVAFGILFYLAAGVQLMLWIDRRYHEGSARGGVVVVGAFVWLPFLVLQAVICLREKARLGVKG